MSEPRRLDESDEATVALVVPDGVGLGRLAAETSSSAPVAPPLELGRCLEGRPVETREVAQSDGGPVGEGRLGLHRPVEDARLPPSRR